MTPQAMNGCWREICPEVVNDFKGFDVEALKRDIVKLSLTAGFTNDDEQDVQELLYSHNHPLSIEDLVQTASPSRGGGGGYETQVLDSSKTM